MSRVARLLSRPAVLLEPVRDELDAYGQPVLTVIEHETLCHYRRVTTDDGSGVGTIVSEDLEVYLSPDVEVGSSWGVRIEGATYSIVGEVTPAWNARTGAPEYRSVICRRSGT